MKQIQRRIEKLEERVDAIDAQAGQVGTLAQYLAWTRGKPIPAEAQALFDERHEIAMRDVAATLADFEDAE